MSRECEVVCGGLPLQVSFSPVLAVTCIKFGLAQRQLRLQLLLPTIQLVPAFTVLSVFNPKNSYTIDDKHSYIPSGAVRSRSPWSHISRSMRPSGLLRRRLRHHHATA